VGERVDVGRVVHEAQVGGGHRVEERHAGVRGAVPVLVRQVERGVDRALVLGVVLGVEVEVDVDAGVGAGERSQTSRPCGAGPLASSKIARPSSSPGASLVMWAAPSPPSITSKSAAGSVSKSRLAT
jgi:hypothetical protein